MKIALNTVVWGKSYIRTFCKYSLSSVLSDRNICSLVDHHDISVNIITTEADFLSLSKFSEFKDLQNRKLKINIDFISQIIPNRKPPIGFGPSKYKYLSELQNFSIKQSIDDDIVIFNYSDFVWGDGSLSEVVRRCVDDSYEAVLGFCLPVDFTKGSAAIDSLRRQSERLSIPNVMLAKIAIDNLHREAKLRYWNAPIFTNTPTYLLWKVDDQGALLRAYHQTVLAVKTDFLKRGFDRNPGLSLDGYYSTVIGKYATFCVAQNSQDVQVISLYDTIIDSRLINATSKEESLSHCLEAVVSDVHRDLALLPIRIHTGLEIDSARWAAVELESAEQLKKLHSAVPFDRAAHERLYSVPLANEESAAMSEWLIRIGYFIKRLFIFLGISNSTWIYLREVKKFFESKNKKEILKQFLARAIIRSAIFDSIVAELLVFNISKRLHDAIYVNRRQASPIVISASNEIQSLLVSFLSSEDRDIYLRKFEDFVEKITRKYLFFDHIGFSFWRIAGEFYHIAGDLRLSKDAFVKCLRSREFVKNLFKKRTSQRDNYIFPALPLKHIGVVCHLHAFDIALQKRGSSARGYINYDQLMGVNETLLSLCLSKIETLKNDELLRQLGEDYSDVNPYLLEALTVDWNWYVEEEAPREARTLTFVHQYIKSIYLKSSDVDRTLEISRNSTLFSAAVASFFQIDENNLQQIKPYTCIHIRTPDFHEDFNRPGVDDFRNTPARSFFPLIQFILTKTKQHIVFVGDPLDSELRSALDSSDLTRLHFYGDSKEKTDFLDVALIALCDEFIATPSGLYAVASVFNKPTLLINFPLYDGLPWRDNQRALSLIYIDKTTNKVLARSSLPEEVGRMTHETSFGRYGLTTRPRSELEILEFYKISTSVSISDDSIGSQKIIDQERLRSMFSDVVYKNFPISKKLNVRKNTRRKIDVLVPTFDRPRKLFELIDSALRLKLYFVTFFIFDDGSTKKEHIPGFGFLSTYEVCNVFDSETIIYERSEESIGVAKHWETYFKNGDCAEYFMAIPDKDKFISREALELAISVLHSDSDTSFVIAPLVQEDRESANRLIKFKNNKWKRHEFIEDYVSDNSLKHCAMWGVFRTDLTLKNPIQAHLNLREYGLDDGFGIDLKLVMYFAAKGMVNSIDVPIIKRTTISGATEKYPLTFAYSYYQYAKDIFLDLLKNKIIKPKTFRKYCLFWITLMLRGFRVSHEHVHGSELEVGIQRIKTHLGSNFHVYILMEIISLRIAPTIEIIRLFSRTVKIDLRDRLKKTRRVDGQTFRRWVIGRML